MNSKFIELDGTMINVDAIAKVNLVENVNGQEHSVLIITDKQGMTNSIEASKETCEQYYMKLLGVTDPIFIVNHT